MGRSNPKINHKPLPRPDTEGKDHSPAPSVQPVEAKRPGTSGTENLLTTNRRQVSENYQRAARAEKQYRVRKRASAVRRDWQATKENFDSALTHLRAGFKTLWGVAKGSRFLIQEKNQQASLRREEHRRVRAMEKRRKLEEILAREEEEEKEEKKKRSRGRRDTSTESKVRSRTENENAIRPTETLSCDVMPKK